MSPVHPPAISWFEAHQQFLEALPQMTATFRFAFRHRRYHDRMDAVAEACGCAWKAWFGLVQRGKDPVAVGVSWIAGFALKHALKGRRIGNPHCGRGAMDIFHPRAQRATGVGVISDFDVERSEEFEEACWKARISSNNRYTPADEAIFRIDFERWLTTLTERKRRMAELLAAGHETSVVANILGVTPAAVSQARPWLADSWRKFQGEAPGIPGRKRSRYAPRQTKMIPA